MRTLRATRNEHNWTCTYPGACSQSVKTLQMTMTLMREGETMKQVSGGTCPVTVVLSKRATHAPRLKAHTTATSAAAIKRPFSLECREVLLDLEHVKSGFTAHDGCTKIPKIRKSLRRDPIMLCCDRCQVVLRRVLLKQSETNKYQQKKKTPSHQHTHTPAHPDTRTPVQTWSHPHRRRNTPAPAPTRAPAPTHAPNARRRPRPFHVGIFQRLAFSTFSKLFKLF